MAHLAPEIVESLGNGHNKQGFRPGAKAIAQRQFAAASHKLATCLGIGLTHYLHGLGKRHGRGIYLVLTGKFQNRP